MKILAIYVGEQSLPNLEHGLRAGIWGFKERAKPQDFETLGAGDFILLATGHTGGGPRTQAEEWLRHSVQSIWYAAVSGAPFESRTVEWPDEQNLSENERYSWRERIDPASTQKLTDVALYDVTKLSRTLSEQLRKSGCANGKG